MPQAAPALMVISIFLSLMAAMIQYREAQKLQNALDDASEGGNTGQQIKANTRGTANSIRVIYGRHRVGANEVYLTTIGETNNDLYMVHALCEGPIKGIVDDEETNPYIWFADERIYEDYDGYYDFDEKKGTTDQTSTTLITTEVPEFTDTMRNTAYVAWYLKYNEDLYRGIPTINYLVDGMLLHDFTDSTAAIAWSDNPVLALYDFFTNPRYGLGLDSSVVDLDSWEEAYDYCIDKEFKINMVVNVSDTSVWQVINNILNLFRGVLNYWNGKYYLRFQDLSYESSVLTIEDEHIYQDSAGKATLQLTDPGYYNMPRGMKVKFINPENMVYNSDTFIIGEEEGIIANMDMVGCTDRSMAGKLALSQLERQQLARSISGRFRDDCILLEPNDIVTFNSTSMNIADQVMRVTNTSYSNTGFVDLTLTYEDEAIYNDVYDIIPQNQYNTTLPDPKIATIITSLTIEEFTYYYRLRSLSRLDIDFDIPVSSWFDHCEVWVSNVGGGIENYKHQMNVTDSFSIDPVEEGETYFVLLRTVNRFGTKQSFSEALTVSRKVVGKSSTPPQSLTYLTAVAGDGSVSIRSTKLDDPDIEIYEFRTGDSWVGGIFLSAKRSPDQELSMVIPKAYTFWCNTKGTNGLYGLYPQYADVTVPVKSGWSLYTSFLDDYTDSTSGQVFNNVEHITYSGDDYLKCSHTGDTTGVYISEVFDTGVVADDYYFYVDTEIVTVGAGTLWSDLFIDSTSSTWAEVNADSRSWRDMFEIEVAPQVRMTIWYKAEVGHDWSYIDDAQILAAVASARYFKVEIEIIDPATNVNAYIKEYALRLYTKI